MASQQELFERVESILPGIAQRRRYVSDHGVIHPDSLKECEEIEIMKTLIPKRYGGFELDLDTMAGIIRRLSANCMSTGWIMAFFVGHNWMITRFNEQTQNDVFDDNPAPKVPGQIRPTIAAKKVTGGYELTGKSHWNSGIVHGDWVLTGILIEGEGPKLALVKAGDFQIDEVWDMAAMEGTGSHDMICDGTFVPEHRTTEIGPFVEGYPNGRGMYDNPLYAMPVLPFMYTEVAGVFAGGLTGATHHFVNMLSGGDPTYSPGKLAELPTVHLKIGEAAARANAANKLTDALVQEILGIRDSRGITFEDRLRLKVDMGYLVNHCRDSINSLIHDAGARSFENKSPIQAFFRDINTLSVHAFWDWSVCREQYGRGQVGLKPTHPLL
ncbi:MAG: hypothetical protein H6978_08765 [Gammaproteobacteria bacterium]|nr:hypothetical protein [Gammaproteobacteria bacterium]